MIENNAIKDDSLNWKNKNAKKMLHTDEILLKPFRLFGPDVACPPPGVCSGCGSLQHCLCPLSPTLWLVEVETRELANSHKGEGRLVHQETLNSVSVVDGFWVSFFSLFSYFLDTNCGREDSSLDGRCLITLMNSSWYVGAALFTIYSLNAFLLSKQLN